MASSAVGIISTPNLPCSADTGDVFDDDIFLGYDCRMQHLSLMRSRSRRPLSVDDVRVAEEFLTKSSLDNDYKLCGDDSGFFSPSSLSSSSFSSSEKTWMSPPGTFISGFFNTQKPTAKKRLYSYPEDTKLRAPSEPSMESIFKDIYEDIGASWRKLGRHMLKREYFLNNIDEDFKGVGEKAYQLLLKWKVEEGETATPQVLFQAVVHIKRTDIAKKLMMLVPSLLSLSHLLDSVIASGSTLYNSKENPENLKVEKVLCEGKKVVVCASMVTSQRFVLKLEEGEEDAFAVRKCIDCKALRQKAQCLRKTEEFLKDLQMKQKMIQDLLDVIKQLQNHLLKQHQYISRQQFSCQNCGQYTMKQDLVQKELTLLHHELERMSQYRNRRISISGIPSERIYNLATRTYSVCEEHREMHLCSRRRRSVCQQHPDETMDSDDSDDHIEGPLMCALNVIIGIGRRRKVTQSLKSKKSSSYSKRKLTKANSNPLSSRQSYLLAQENPITMPSFSHSPDWSGVPAFKLSSDFKSPVSSGNARHQDQDRHCKVSANPTPSHANKHDHLFPLTWLNDPDSDEVII